MYTASDGERLAQMFIKLTKKDGSPVWLNASFIVTVESVRGGGSIVVPVGDGLDYEVSESVETVLPMIEKAQGAVSVVPVPTTDSLSSVAEEPFKESPVEREKPAAPKPKQKTGPAEPAETGADAPAAPPVFEAPAEMPQVSDEAAAAGVAAVAAFNEVKAKEAEAAEGAVKPKRVRKTRTKPAAPGVPATEGERKPARRRSTRKAPLELSDEQVSRLRSMKPRSFNKLSNVLKSPQFGIAEPETTIKALVEHDIITVDEQTQHVEWLAAVKA